MVALAMELWRSCGTTFVIFASKTAGSDCPIDVLDVGVQTAELALAFGAALA
jgi:hypothetical protein